ncbi:Transposable element Tcb1 transposase, partial [Stegodyphus mimosarum]
MWTPEWNEVNFIDETSNFCLQHHDGRIRVWRHRGERMLNSCVKHRDTGPAPCVMVWGCIGYHSRTPLVRIAGTLNSQRYISEVLIPVVLPYLQDLPTAIFQQNNARPHVARIVQGFFVNRQIELLPWLALSPDLSQIENMWSMVAERLIQITSQAATPDQLRQYVKNNKFLSAFEDMTIDPQKGSSPRKADVSYERPCSESCLNYTRVEEKPKTTSNSPSQMLIGRDLRLPWISYLTALQMRFHRLRNTSKMFRPGLK